MLDTCFANLDQSIRRHKVVLRVPDATLVGNKIPERRSVRELVLKISQNGRRSRLEQIGAAGENRGRVSA